MAGEITLLQDPTQIGSSQYDFQITVTHELGHALGLGMHAGPGESMPASVPYPRRQGFGQRTGHRANALMPNSAAAVWAGQEAQ
jgi:hypothetical protein